ncbi:Ribosome biogenesis protein BOP1-like protein [Entamoeba marina]
MNSHEDDDINTSDEESIDTLGNIPIEWYDELEHQGYGHDGKPLAKPTQGNLDSIDRFLALTDDPNYYKTVYDENGNATVLSADDIRLVNSILSNQTSQAEQDIPNVIFPYDDWMIPLNDYTPPKSRFIPSTKEHKQIRKLANKLRRQYITLPQRIDKSKKARVHDIWGTGTKRRTHHLPLPPAKLPGNNDSYHPAPEYKSQITNDYNRLMDVPQYNKLLSDIYGRCLEIYRAPRKLVKVPQKKRSFNGKNLKPFPSNRNGVIRTNDVIRCVDVDPNGEFVVVGGDDGTVTFVDSITGMSVSQLQFDDPIRDIVWSSNDILFIAVGHYVHCVTPNVQKKTCFLQPDENLSSIGVLLSIYHPHVVKHVSLHRKGYYLSCIFGSSSRNYCVIHHIPSKKSQNPLKSLKGTVQHCIFHTSSPEIIVSTLNKIAIVDLQKNVTRKRLTVSTRCITNIALHPSGDHLLVSTFESKCIWFDLQAADEPYKVMKLHSGPCRSVAYHPSYPLFATVGDDAKIQVMHSTVYNDITLDATIIPLVKLSGHEKKGQLGATDVVFHPFMPWLYSTGADGSLQWYTDWF